MPTSLSTEVQEFGCLIRGVDVRTLKGSDKDRIRDLLYRHRLIVLKDQDVDEAAFCNFSHALGQPVPYLQDNYHHPDYPLIFVSSNVKKDGKAMGVARTGGYWHSDTAFECDPKFITMLMPKILPPAYPRGTLFIDMAEVYRELPARLKAELEDVQFVHSGRWRYKVRAEDVGKDIHEILSWVDAFAPPVSHPAVIRHPYTNEKIIYGTRGFTVGIDGATLDHAARVLRQVFDFAESPRFVRKVRWSMGDIIVWDNRFLAHCSDRNEGPEEPTMMYRITLKDGMPLSAGEVAVPPPMPRRQKEAVQS